MTCNVANLSAITNANGRTEWHYRTHDHWRDVVERGYFEPAPEGMELEAEAKPVTRPMLCTYRECIPLNVQWRDLP